MRTHVRWIAFAALLLPAMLVGLIAVPRVLQAAPVTRHVTACAPSGAGSLADTIATVAQSGDTIVFDQNCTIAVGATINIPSAKDLTIDALVGTRTVVLDGGGAAQILHLQAVNNHGPSVTLNGLTLQNGKASQGGAIFNDQGALTVTNSAIINNTATTGGGGIENAGGTLTVSNVTFFGNKVTGATEATGGAIENNAFGKLTITSSTISGNSVSSGAAQSASGGGIFDFSTVANAVKLTDTIVAGNTGGNCNGAEIGTGNPNGLASGGHNLIGVNHSNPADASCGTDFTGLAAAGEIIGTDATPVNPKLGPLANNGGTTQTLQLLLGSPAIDAGGASCPAGVATDQRGVPRPVGGGCDIGAFESGIAVQGVAASVATGSNATLKVGETTQLKATATYTEGSTADVTGSAAWSSSDATVASVDSSGKVTAKAGGTVTVTATVGGKSGTTSVTVTPPTFTGVQPAPAPAGRPAGGASAPATGPTVAPNPVPAPRTGP